MRSIDCYQCVYNRWGLGIGVGVACVHPDNQKYNPKRRKQGEERTFHNSTTQVSRIPDGCELRKERDWQGLGEKTLIVANSLKFSVHLFVKLLFCAQRVHFMVPSQISLQHLTSFDETPTENKMINSKSPIIAWFVVLASSTTNFLQDVQNAIKSVRISTKIEQF